MTSFKPLVLAVASAFALSLSAGAFAQTPNSPMAGGSATAGKVSAADRDFMTKAAAGGMAEVALGQLGQQKASADSVKEFGGHMVDDHTKANGELKAMADAKGVTLPAEPMPAQKSAMAKIDALSGPAFDSAFMKQMLADHKKTIALFEKCAKGSDADVKAFATKTLPTLKAHLKMAQSVAKQTMDKGKTASRETGAATRG